MFALSSLISQRFVNNSASVCSCLCFFDFWCLLVPTSFAYNFEFVVPFELWCLVLPTYFVEDPLYFAYNPSFFRTLFVVVFPPMCVDTVSFGMFSGVHKLGVWMAT